MSKISFDYDSIKNRIIQILSSKSEWASFLDYGTIDNVISSIANEMAYEIQYAEYNSMENFWNMARNRSSLLQMSPMHGFVVPRKQASKGTLMISTSESFDSSHSSDIMIPKFFQFSGNNIYVCADKDYVLNANTDYKEIGCIQGEVKDVEFLAEGIRYEEKTIIDDSIDNSFFELTVNNVKWNYVDSLFLYNAEDNVYQIRTLPDLSGIVIRFGNGIFGKKLEKNDVVNFKYISTLGSKGNIYSSIINTVESQAFDSLNDSVQLYCKNTTNFVGGVDYPSLDYIREISPKVYQTGDRASSDTDYYTILKQYSYLSKILVWGAYEVLKDTKDNPWNNMLNEANVVHLALLEGEGESADDYTAITDIHKEEIVDDLYNICNPTDLIYFEEVNKVPVVFYIEGKIKNASYTTSEVESNIRTTLNDVYGIANMNFGESIYNSDYVRLIDEVDGIDNHISSIELYQNTKLSTMSSNIYTGAFSLPIYPIDYKTFKIYVKNENLENSEYELMATCDSNGNIVGEGLYITTNSYVGLNDGKGYLKISNGLSGDIDNIKLKIIYNYIDADLKNTSRSNILYYDNAVIKLYY